MNPITIRHSEPHDLEQVRAIYAEETAYADTLQLPFPSAAVWEKRLAPGNDAYICLVAVRDDALVGQLGLEVFRSPRRRHVATLGIGVKASARKTGVASALMVAAIELCERWLNVSRMEIEVYTDNRAAIELYQKFGFVIEGTCRDYAFRAGRYVDAHVMARLRT
jgi:L-phenylalanine/L-methionine N-acetyltransferase